MEIVKKIVKELNNFYLKENNFYENSKTQKSAEITENFVEKTFNNVFGEENIKIFKNGSQKHPDFYIFNKTKFLQNESYQCFLKEEKKSKSKSKNGIIDKCFPKTSFLKVEVKSYKKKNGRMIFNDTFPFPGKEDNTLYVFFSEEEKKVFLNSSFYMAEKDKNDIETLFLKSKENIKNAQMKSKEIWKNTYTSTKIRPTYSLEHKYFNNVSLKDEYFVKSINELLKRIEDE